MSWFSESIVRDSEKNGTISAQRTFGSWRVTVGGFEQTGREMQGIWRDMFSTFDAFVGVQKIKRILMLGLGGGGELQVLYKRFPGAEIVAVEHDPQMISLTRHIRLYAPHPFPTVYCADAREGLHKVQGVFDLIIIDLFRGGVPSKIFADADFLSDVHTKLAHDGYVVTNVYKNTDFFSVLNEKFHSLKQWRVGPNYFGLFQSHTISDAVRSGFRPLRQWSDLNTFESIPKFFQPSRIGEVVRGSYWRLWPFSFEQYEGDTEPVLQPLSIDQKKPLRIIMWQRTSRSDVPKGWIAFTERPAYKIGFIPLTKNYYQTWSETLRRSRKKFLTEYSSQYSLEEVSFEEFREAYRKSTLPLTLKDGMLYEIDFRARNPRTKMTFLGARRISDRRIMAGVAHLRSSSLPLSYYQGGFFLPEVRDEPLMTGLFDRWFESSVGAGVKFIDLGNFWKKGEDGSWKGFSLFKAKCNPLYFFLPPLLYQFRIGKNR
jgi:hypothetical protein